MLTHHTIDIRLNSTGFSGADVEDLLPDFITERETSVGLTWYRSANGPESFSILLTIYAALGVVAGEFIKELATDLYSWGKQKLLNNLRSKRYPDCYISIKLDDVEVFFHEEDLFTDPEAGKVILNVFETLPSLLPLIDASKSKSWEIFRRKADGQLLVKPADSNS